MAFVLKLLRNKRDELGNILRRGDLVGIDGAYSAVDAAYDELTKAIDVLEAAARPAPKGASGAPPKKRVRKPRGSGSAFPRGESDDVFAQGGLTEPAPPLEPFEDEPSFIDGSNV